MTHSIRRATATVAPVMLFCFSILTPNLMQPQSAPPVAADDVTEGVWDAIDPSETGADDKAKRATRTDHDPPANFRLSSTDNGPTVRAQSSITYTVTFQGNWTTASTPGGVVGGAHFTTLIGAIHNDMVTFWESGGTATAGVEGVAELGSTGTFRSEINANSNAVSVIQQGVSGGGTGSATFEITLTHEHPLVTLLSMIGPSPDWFVGVSGLSLLDDQGQWMATRRVNLYPYDAGTEDGTEFTLSNPATSPQGVITSIRGTGKFSNVRMARLTFTRESPIDYDSDDDNLIEIATLAQLNAVRYDLDGNGAVDEPSDTDSYGAAFPDAETGMGCTSGCSGYELSRDLDFDTNGSGSANSGDTYWNSGSGWAPIGAQDDPFATTLEGNGHTFSNLYINRSSAARVGLFHTTGSSSVIRNLGVIEADVTGSSAVGSLAGFHAGTISAGYATGSAAGNTSAGQDIGGLVGSTTGTVTSSYATVRVSGQSHVGGLAGSNSGTITASYATGRVSGSDEAGGLVGANSGTITASYATGRVSGSTNVNGLAGSNTDTITASYWDTSTSGQTTGSGGQTTSQLQSPTGYSGIYQNWNVDLDGDNTGDSPWHFGTGSQYPALSADVDGSGAASWQEFGYQLREGPTLTAASDPSGAALSWTEVATDHWDPAPEVTYTLYREEGATVESLLTGSSDLQHTDTDVMVGDARNYQVAAVVDGGEPSRSTLRNLVVMDVTPPTVTGVEITSNPGSDRTYAADDEIQVTVTFSETVDVTGTPGLTLELGGGTRTATYGGGTGTGALVFVYDVADGDSDTDGLGVEGDSLSGGTIEDTADNTAERDHDGLSANANHKVDGVKPALASTGGAVVNGTTLTLNYAEPLDGSSKPDTGDFTVSGGDQTRNVTRVSMSGSTVRLTLSAGVEHGETGIQVSYTPGLKPLRDVPGNQAEALSQESVTNETPDTTAPEVSSLDITSNPGSDETYAAGDDIEVTVTFNETVVVTGTPQLRLRVGTGTKTAGYDRGTDSASLVFAYEVADRDEDTDGVSVQANQLRLNGGTIEDEAENAAALAHEALSTQAGQRVDGVKPVFVSAAVDGSSLTLTYGEALDGGSRPATGDFTVEVGGNGRSITGVAVSQSMVMLTLNPAVEHGDTGIRVSYTPGTNPIQDAVGNDAVMLSNRQVTNTTDAPNTAPEITTQGALTVRENQALVRQLAGRDTDLGDEVTGWSIVGGADQGEFSITSDAGELSFQATPDYEDPQDVASTDPANGAGDNEYVVTVEVTSGAGGRELTAQQTFIVRVTDVTERPEKPDAPVISGETADSLTVSWSEPDNTGPDITDYDVQYRKKDRGSFRPAQHEGTERSRTLMDLDQGTDYEVQVRATNDEGTGNWSDSGEGMTITPLTLEMTAMEEPPVSGAFTVRISFSEPVAGFFAGDIDTGQDPSCRDDQNNPVGCTPIIGGPQTADNRVFTGTVTPETNSVAHSYTLTLTVPSGRVSSSVGSKPNEEPEEPLAVRVSPPGAPEAISSMGLRASPGSGSVRLSWNRPSDNGGSGIVRYEYRYAASGESWSEWKNVGAGSRGVTVGGLINGREYDFEARAVNALGKGAVETARATPEYRAPPPPPRQGGGGGGGGGGGFLFPPQAPASLTALPGDGSVRLEWSPPENDGGTPILRYEYRLKPFRGEFGDWTPIPDSAPDEVNASGYMVMDLDNGTIHVFELRAVNLVNEGPETEAVEVVMPLDGTYWSNFLGEDLEGEAASLEWMPFGGSARSLRLRFAGELRFEQDELDGEGEVEATREGGYRYRYTGHRTGELRLDYDGGESCELRMTYEGVGAGRYSYRCGGALQGQGRFRLTGLNRRPEITGAAVFEMVENRTSVGQLQAADPDEGDAVGGYGIAGGADGALFTVVEGTGELRFKEAPDYERPGDVESGDPQSPASDNEYVLEVAVRSGEGERQRQVRGTVRVRVSDEEEPPGAPEAPEVTPEGTDRLKVSWREPENRGPEISGYEVRYRQEGEAGYRDGGHEGAGLALTLSGLEEGTDYRVQVRAANEEGTGEWSEPGEGRTDTEEPDPEDPSNFSGADLEGRRLTLRLTGEEGATGRMELHFGEDNRFEQVERGGEQAAARSEGSDSRSESAPSRSGSYAYERTGPGRGRVRLDYDDGSSCELRLSFTESGVGGFVYDCGEADPAEGNFRLTTGSLFVPVILSAAGRNQSFFTSELTLANRGDEEVEVKLSYRADAGGGSGSASDTLPAGRQVVKTDALAYLRGLGIPIPERGNRVGTLRVEVRLGSEVGAVARTTTVVPEGRAGLAYPGVAEEAGFSEPVYLCGLRQNSRDRSNVAFQNMGAAGQGAITIRTTVYSGEASDTRPRVLADVELKPGEFHQHSGLLGGVENGYVKVERVEGEAPFYAYGVINDQVNSDGSFVFPVTAGSLEGKRRQTLPVIVETSEFSSELTVTNFSRQPRALDFEFVSEQIRGEDKRVEFGMTLEAGEQAIVPELVEALRREGVAGLGTMRGVYLGPVFVTAREGDLSGVVIGARTGSQGGGGTYSVFYNAAPEGEGFVREAWVEGLQQNQENRSNLALVNTGEVDGSASVFHLEIYDGETGRLVETVATRPVPARSWHQVNGILSRASAETRQGYVRIEKVSGENPFLAYGVVNDGGAPGQRSGDGAYLPAGE